MTPEKRAELDDWMKKHGIYIYRDEPRKRAALKGWITRRYHQAVRQDPGNTGLDSVAWKKMINEILALQYRSLEGGPG